MTIRLTVERERWWNHVAAVAADIDGLVPVVKGNGYGFSRSGLAQLAIKLSEIIAVGTVYETASLPEVATPVVLTPTLTPPPTTKPVLTVSNERHIHALEGWAGRVVIKLESSMHRYGGDIDLVATAQQAGLRTVGVAIHPPLAGDDMSHRREIVKWIPNIDPSLDVWVSHLAPDTYHSLPSSHRYKFRSGSYLWHGDRGALKLDARVLETRAVSAGDRVGYQLNEIDVDGTLVMVGAGTANGVQPLPDRRSPFHFDRQRLALVEPPHMHTSMVLVPDGGRAPEVGDWVDLQRPLHMTTVDELRWI